MAFSLQLCTESIDQKHLPMSCRSINEGNMWLVRMNSVEDDVEDAMLLSIKKCYQFSSFSGKLTLEWFPSLQLMCDFGGVKQRLWETICVKICTIFFKEVIKVVEGIIVTEIEGVIVSKNEVLYKIVCIRVPDSMWRRDTVVDEKVDEKYSELIWGDEG